MDPETRAAFDDLRAAFGELGGAFGDLRAAFGELREYMDQRFTAVDRRIEVVEQTLDRKILESEERTRRHFDVSVEAFRLDGVNRRVLALDEQHAQTRTRVDQLEVRVLALEQPERRKRRS